MYRLGDVLTLSDNKNYSVAFTAKYNNEDYIYLVEHDNFSNTFFYKCSGDNLIEVEEPKVIEELLKLFATSDKQGL